MDSVGFLKRALPDLGLAWRGFRRVKNQVEKRIRRRICDLDLGSIQAYEDYLAVHPEERAVLGRMCWITISRFYRDRFVFDQLTEILGRLARDPPVSVLSVGAACGEEPYTVAMALSEVAREVPAKIVALEANEASIARARRGVYPRGTLRDLPSAWVERWFREQGGEMHIDARIRKRVSFVCANVQTDALVDGPFDVILCRNLAFTYFDQAGQRRMLESIVERLSPRGWVVVGRHESLPPKSPLVRDRPGSSLYRLGG